MELLPSQGNLLRALLDVAYERHAILASNLANVNTPGFRRQDIDFQKSLQAALQVGPGKERFRPVVVDAPTTVKRDGNTVSPDLEIARLQQNALLYQVAAEVLSRKFTMMRRALTSAA